MGKILKMEQTGQTKIRENKDCTMDWEKES